jgi:signal transduction histidine kinase
MVSEPGQRQAYLQTLQREADRLGRLVENVLAYARLEKRRPPRPAAPAQLGPLVHAHAGRLHARAAEAGRPLELRLDAPSQGLWVRVDGEALEQVLFNLVDNACKYGAGTIRVSAERRGAKVALLVHDEGPGVPKDMARRLFEPFSRAAEEAAGAAPGVGLGLALCRRLMRALGGDLRHETAASGARFVVLLPAARE